MPTSMRWLVLALCAACGSSNPPTMPLGGANLVTGDVVDFQTGIPVTDPASVSTSGLVPVPTISVTGASFMIEDVPDNSSFQILASAGPTHHATLSPSIYVVTDDVTGIKAPAVAETFLASTATGFGITPSPTKGVLFVRLVDSTGAPKTGVAGSNLVLADANGASGPHFLDASLAPSTATVTSASGWAVFFEVNPGIVSLGQAANATVTLAMPSSLVGAGTVSIATIQTTDGAPPALPTNVSFATSVVPIFTNRGCVACHSSNGIGKSLGGLSLDGGTQKVYKSLVLDSTTRVVLSAPETSKVLTMPSAETPPDGHPNVTFTSPQDPDYIKILVWIREGAKNN